MKKSCTLILFILSLNSFAQIATKVYEVEFKAHLLTSSKDLPHEINKQINHSLGPAITNQYIGKRSSLTEKFNYTILNQTLLENGFSKIEYSFKGRLVTEVNLDINTYEVILPLNPSTIYKRANYRCASRSGEDYFYQSWSPTFKKCRLEKGIDFDSFALSSFSELGTQSLHRTEDFKVGNELNLFFYFGSDFHSMRRFGHGETSYKQSMKSYLKMGFRYENNDAEELEIFGQERFISRYQKLTGPLNGIQTNVHFLLGNPDDATPEAKYEFFKFFKYAFENGSGIYYGGHAGLGENLNFDLLEKEYNEKITYNQSQKQMMIFSGCSTYLQSSGFFFNKKPKNLVLATNGLSVKLRVNKYLPVTFLNIFQSSEAFTNEDVFTEIYNQFRNSGAKWGYYPMTAVESN